MPADFSYKFYSITGEALEAMYEAILDAKESILWETFIFIDDAAGKPFVNLLCDKACAGVKVIVIVDGIGSVGFSSASIDRLRQSGVRLVIHNSPWRPSWYLRDWWYRIWYRSHRKLLIIDDEMAFVGGVNVRRDMLEWNDMQMMVTGKVVRQLTYKFAKDFVRSGGKKMDVHKWLHPKQKYLETWKEKVRFIMHHPVVFGKGSTIKTLYEKSLALAKESFTLVTPYYAPDGKFLKMIAEAKQRGVKVNILVPLRPDIWIMKILGVAFYSASVKAGATVYFLPRMNHAKVVKMDEKLGIVGSANFTPRSFFLNRESGVVFEEKDMVAELNSILENWKKESTVMDKVSEKRGGIIRRIIVWFANILRNYV